MSRIGNGLNKLWRGHELELHAAIKQSEEDLLMLLQSDSRRDLSEESKIERKRDKSKKMHVSAYFHRKNSVKENPEDNNAGHLQEVGVACDEKNRRQNDTFLSLSLCLALTFGSQLVIHIYPKVNLSTKKGGKKLTLQAS